METVADQHVVQFSLMRLSMPGQFESPQTISLAMLSMTAFASSVESLSKKTDFGGERG
jgi:hypothetical protein